MGNVVCGRLHLVRFSFDSAALRRGTAALGRSGSGVGTSASGQTSASREAATTPSATPCRKRRTKDLAEPRASVLKERTGRHRYQNLNVFLS